MESGLKGKRALITGGGTGIGRGIALSLAAEGVDIAIASRNPSAETIAAIEAHGVRALRLVADVGHEDQVVRMVQETIDGLGGLDLYINNVAAHWDEPVTKVTGNGWLNSINTNLSACVYACREVSRHFIKQGTGSILIVGSTAAHAPLATETGYGVSKAGLKPYMQVLAVELAPFKIRANMVTPGYLPTEVSAAIIGDREQEMLDQIPLRCPGKPEDFGNAAIWLLSDTLSAYTTGSELLVDGGFHLRPTSLFSDDEVRQMNAN
ncbi:MAG: SDR family oxidoreductase [Lentisphaeria bacterium]|jgi:2-deoxy-D-gluconate 3-dehydrogenase|nr:SDR family oxidoreductase [Lentisphaeria bacterium]